MKPRTTDSRQIVLELTEEQIRQIERTTGKLVTELEVEIVETREPLDGRGVEFPAPDHNNSIKEGETQ